MLRLGPKITGLALVFSLAAPTQALAADLIRTENTQAKPIIRSVIVDGVARADDYVELRGSRFDAVVEVGIDSLAAEFQVIDSTRMRVKIPSQIQPGDVLVSLSGKFGRASFNNLFEVSTPFTNPEARVTIGSFNGYAAVYTKNLMGHRLLIRIDSRERRIPQLASNYTSNLTKVGAGKTVDLSVYLDSTLIQTRRITIR